MVGNLDIAPAHHLHPDMTVEASELTARHMQHGPRRLWRRPWRVICQCGLGAWPCPAQRMLARQAEFMARPAWDGRTTQLALARSVPFTRSTPLLTRGQRARSRGRRGGRP